MAALGVALCGCMPAFTLHGPPGLRTPAPHRARSLHSVQLALGAPDLSGGLPGKAPAATLEGGAVLRTNEAGSPETALEAFGRVNVGNSGLRGLDVAVDPRAGLRGCLRLGPLVVTAEASGMLDFAPTPSSYLFGGTVGAATLVGLRAGPLRLYGGAEGAASWLGFLGDRSAEQIQRLLLSTFLGVGLELGAVTLYATGGPTWNDSFVLSLYGPAQPPQAVRQHAIWTAGGGLRLDLAALDRSGR